MIFTWFFYQWSEISGPTAFCKCPFLMTLGSTVSDLGINFILTLNPVVQLSTFLLFHILAALYMCLEQSGGAPVCTDTTLWAGDLSLPSLHHSLPEPSFRSSWDRDAPSHRALQWLVLPYHGWVSHLPFQPHLPVLQCVLPLFIFFHAPSVPFSFSLARRCQLWNSLMTFFLLPRSGHLGLLLCLFRKLAQCSDPLPTYGGRTVYTPVSSSRLSPRRPFCTPSAHYSAWHKKYLTRDSSRTTPQSFTCWLSLRSRESRA